MNVLIFNLILLVVIVGLIIFIEMGLNKKLANWCACHKRLTALALTFVILIPTVTLVLYNAIPSMLSSETKYAYAIRHEDYATAYMIADEISATDSADLAVIASDGKINDSYAYYCCELTPEGTLNAHYLLDDFISRATIDVSGWTDIVNFDCAGEVLVGVRSDGNVLITGKYVTQEMVDSVSTWQDIVAVKVLTSVRRNAYQIFGLKSDGTVVSTNSDWEEEYGFPSSDWTNITHIDKGDDTIMGVKANGDVVAAGQDANLVDEWTNIESIDYFDYYTYIGYKRDGSVVYANNNKNLDESAKDDKEIIESWQDIESVYSCTYGRNPPHTVETFGLKTDGTVVTTGNYTWERTDYSGRTVTTVGIEDWTDIIAVYADTGYYVVGLKSDGTSVIADGRMQ